jgi:rhodanese-related sulfurtransferase
VNQRLMTAVKEGVLILVATAALGFVVNGVRDGGIPVIADPEAFRVRTEAEFMKPEDAFRLFEAGEAMFVDARDSSVYAVRHIEGAINLSPASDVAEDLAMLVAANPQVVVYAADASQRQAGVVADRLLDMGFTKVFVLYEGMEGWVKRGFPVGTSGD